MRELTEAEIALVNSSLENSGRRMKLESSDEGGTKLTKMKVEKVARNRRRPFILQPAFWGGVFLFIPTIVTLAIMSVISRVDAAMGSGALQTLSKLSEGELKALGFSEAGLDWIPQVVELYESRTIILVITWSVCLLVAGLFFFLHFRKARQNASEQVEEARFSLKDEMAELNQAYEPELAGYDDEDTELDQIDTREAN